MCSTFVCFQQRTWTSHDSNAQKLQNNSSKGILQKQFFVISRMLAAALLLALRNCACGDCVLETRHWSNQTSTEFPQAYTMYPHVIRMRSLRRKATPLLRWQTNDRLARSPTLLLLSTCRLAECHLRLSSSLTCFNCASHNFPILLASCICLCV